MIWSISQINPFLPKLLWSWCFIIATETLTKTMGKLALRNMEAQKSLQLPGSHWKVRRAGDTIQSGSKDLSTRSPCLCTSVQALSRMNLCLNEGHLLSLPRQVLITPGSSFMTDPKVSELTHKIILILRKYHANLVVNSIKFYKRTVQLKELSSD